MIYTLYKDENYTIKVPNTQVSSIEEWNGDGVLVVFGLSNVKKLFPNEFKITKFNIGEKIYWAPFFRESADIHSNAINFILSEYKKNISKAFKYRFIDLYKDGTNHSEFQGTIGVILSPYYIYIIRPNITIGISLEQAYIVGFNVKQYENMVGVRALEVPYPINTLEDLQKEVQKLIQ